MSPRLQAVALAALVVATAAGFASLVRLRLSQGDIYPTYSSLRSDPLGTRALHDGLALLPELTITRSLDPVQRLRSEPPRTILIAGVSQKQWESIPRSDALAIDTAARAGSRVVIALRPALETEQEEEESNSPWAKAMRDREEKGREALARAGTSVWSVEDLHDLWGVRLVAASLRDPGFGARRAAIAPRELPASLLWEGGLHLSPMQDAGWRVLYRFGGEPVLAERNLGSGTLVIATDSYFLSNEALRASAEPALLSWVVGPHAHVEFEEAHLGLVRATGVAALARSYGLTTAGAALAVLAGLIAWRRMALFVPPRPSFPT